MMRFSALPAALLALLVTAPPAAAQQQAQETPDPDNGKIFAPLELPTPNSYRTGSGAPGPEYWQQGVDYRIRVRLDPVEHRVSGSETVTYTNNSPTPLKQIWLQLDQNRFDASSEGARITPPEERFTGAFEGGGYDISNLRVERDGRAVEPAHLIRGTTMRIDLQEPVAPGGGTLRIHLDYAFTVPRYGADRMGRLDVERGTVYELAQWYPRVFTYDDIHGWNVLPYLGLGEFYLEYGDFDVEITVPREYIVVGTGELQNPGEVLTAEQRERLDRARESAETVTILGRDEVGTSGSRPAGEGPLTWRFHADSVRDFSWAASGGFIWDAAGWEDVLLMSVYPHEGLGSNDRPGWERSTQYVRHSIRYYSATWERYPYPVAINVAGRVGGMEYPMIVFCSVNARGPGLFGVTDHEFGHEWFPMLVGSDERRYFWMDEGLNSFMNQYSAVAFYGDRARRQFAGTEAMNRLAGAMQAQEQPTFTRADRMLPDQFGFLAYAKPAAGLRILREVILGPDRFDPAFQEYIDRWAYRHPQPADFFRTMEEVSGESLDWFWRGWFLTTDVLDQAVTGVETRGDTTRIHLENQAGLVMPVEMELRFADGSSERRELPVEAWHSSDRFTAIVLGKRLEAVTLDPDGQLPDVERGDNAWRRE